jgi:hypothetical protein
MDASLFRRDVDAAAHALSPRDLLLDYHPHWMESLQRLMELPMD